MKKLFDEKYIKFAFSLLCVILISILFYFLILRIDNVINILFSFIKIFTPIIFGLIIAYLLNPLIIFLENKIFKKIFKNIKSKKKNSIIRSSAIMFSSIIFLIILYFSIFKIAPELFTSIQNIIGNVPNYIKNAKELLLDTITNSKMEKTILENYDSIGEFITTYINKNISPKLDVILLSISNGIIGALKIFYNFIMGFIISIYLLFNKEKYIGESKKLIYGTFNKELSNKILYNLRYIDKIFGGFFIGKIIDSLIIGILCFIFMFIFDMPYPLLISVIVSITNIIPYFGPFLGAIPSVLLILLVSPHKVIGFIVFIFILQQFDGMYLGPKILGKNTGLSSFWVLFSILIFGSLFGFVGMIIGVPLFAIIYSFIHNLTNQKLKDKNLPVNSNLYTKLKYVDDIDDLKY